MPALFETFAGSVNLKALVVGSVEAFIEQIWGKLSGTNWYKRSLKAYSWTNNSLAES